MHLFDKFQTYTRIIENTLRQKKEKEMAEQDATFKTNPQTNDNMQILRKNNANWSEPHFGIY